MVDKRRSKARRADAGCIFASPLGLARFCEMNTFLDGGPLETGCFSLRTEGGEEIGELKKERKERRGRRNSQVDARGETRGKEEEDQK